MEEDVDVGAVLTHLVHKVLEPPVLQCTPQQSHTLQTSPGGREEEGGRGTGGGGGGGGGGRGSEREVINLCRLRTRSEHSLQSSFLCSWLDSLEALSATPAVQNTLVTPPTTQ